MFGPKLANCKSAALKGCNDKLDAVICQIGLVPQHLRSLLDVIEWTVLCTFVCKVGYFEAIQIGRLYYKNRGYDLLASLIKWN